MIAVDTNVLVYAHREDSPHHVAAMTALAGLAEGPRAIAVPWPCAHEFLAIATHPRVYDPPSAPDAALESINDLMAFPGVAMLSESADHGRILATLLSRSGVVGPKIHDARIAAICLGHGVTELWSADRDFSAFPQLRTRNPLH
ncbi:type II toxin-antitoxin system VapC family toxin [Luteipulveratus mongoliensis]|uniref:Ribonuclease VapC n=1 Tax=Luteipulveratus mongoliensis TaxID=571913 RepID=A0A0K1JG33_9MICO|nr:TA system VapC family ribonuclease toxin [Luteipulveratus mongoliensis]AKU15555.1 toxin PIN [Luteipulveratus mongoliensis]